MGIDHKKFKHLIPNKSRVSASEYNHLVDLVTTMAKGASQDCFIDSTGVHIRKKRQKSGVDIRLFRVVSEATGDGIYNCYEQTLDATEWADTDGDSKFDDKDAVSVEVLNIAESGEDNHALSASDILVAWKMTDDESNIRWIGLSPKFFWWHS